MSLLRRMLRPVGAAAVLAGPWVLAACAEATRPPSERVEIFRTAFGVPHLRAEDLEALGYGLAWVQMEDHGEEVLRRLIASRGERARHLGDRWIEDDVAARQTYRRAVARYDSLPRDVRKVMAGFAAGVNAYVRTFPDSVPDWAASDFGGRDVAARDAGSWSRSRAREILEEMALPDTLVPGVPLDEVLAMDPRDGSNTWAIGPDRTASGEAILLRNPHLAWDAGYYEAHVQIPGDLDFYGDFRVGGAFGIIGGFNRHLGWSTTNNAPVLDQAYRLPLDPERPGRVLFDGLSEPITEEVVEIDVLRDDGRVERVSRRFWSTALGPVIHRDTASVIVLHTATLDTPSRGEQFLRMMRASSLEEWKEAMRVRAMPSSNFIYADADGTILYVWNARLPAFPYAPEDTALAASDRSDVWTGLVPWDSLPRIENPEGGYVQNANDSPHFTTLHRILAPADLPFGAPEPRLRLRSQRSLQLVEALGDDVTLEQVIESKHDLTMLAARRLVPDLVAAVRGAVASGDLPAGADPVALLATADLLEAWDHTAAAAARGAVLFDRWMRRYAETVDTAAFWTEPWVFERPIDTPAGLGDAKQGVAALVTALDETVERWGSADVAWGDVHRARLGGLDLPAPGCSNLLGCFRILETREADDGRMEVTRGDGWIFAVEFTDPVKAYTILAYGQTADSTSADHTSQLDMFLRGEMKPAVFDWNEVEATALRRYRPR